MPTPPERVRVAAYYIDDRGRRLAEETLRRTDPDVLAVHDGVVEGWVDLPGLKTLAEGGLVVDLLDQETPASSGREAQPIIGAGPSSAPDPHSPALEEFKQQSKYVSLLGERLEVSDRPVDSLDPRIHTIGEVVLQPAPEQALDAAVYHIRLHAPMAEEQRETLVDLGIDLAAYEPPDSYRTRLTREQYSAVRRLSFVKAVERYRFAETVTRDVLAKVASEMHPGVEMGDEPTLLSAPGPPEPTRATFDCVLHRIADRERVTRLIHSYAEAEVLESSYLYIRFSAPPDARFLAAVAKLPEVRRLGVYTPPKLLADHARKIVGIDAIASQTSVASPALTGEGELVAVFDSGIDADHPDLVDRVHSVEAVPGATEKDHVGHGTHVAGIIAGTGAASDRKIRGLAPGAKLAIVGVVATDGLEARVLTPANWADLLERAVARGAKLINLSTGRGAYGDYDFGSLSLDEFVYHHPDVLVVVSAGNEG
ncbi:MAG: S8 family serine peptidase, partial [Actinomycetota bacterium]